MTVANVLRNAIPEAEPQAEMQKPGPANETRLKTAAEKKTKGSEWAPIAGVTSAGNTDDSGDQPDKERTRMLSLRMMFARQIDQSLPKLLAMEENHRKNHLEVAGGPLPIDSLTQ